jgi:hypothetical protein
LLIGEILALRRLKYNMKITVMSGLS